MKSSVTGAAGIRKEFKRLGRSDVLTAPINSASRFALGPVLSAARRNAPVASGLLKKSLVIRQDKRARKDSPRWLVGASGIARRYAHLAEFGRVGESGSRFLTRSFEETKETAVARFGPRFWEALAKKMVQK